MQEINSKQELIDATVELFEEQEFDFHADLTSLFDNIVEMLNVQGIEE
jgi:hypothetical protein